MMKSYNGCKIYLNKNERNEATSYYIDIVERALKRYWGFCTYVETSNEIEKTDVVVVITIRSYLKVISRNFNQHIIFWFQGIEPEELSYAIEHKRIYDRVRILGFSVLERIILSKAKLLLFVSDTMRCYYEKKHGYKGTNYVVIPCFNQKLNRKYFYDEDKYMKMSFVYAGALLKWQCIEETLQLYGIIKEKYPNATLTLLTKDQEAAKEMVGRCHLKDVSVKFVPLVHLNDELSIYKYGFLLREDIILNNVATPTKFNSYLALGIIPILSNVVGDYVKYVNSMRYVIALKNEKDFDSALQYIDNLERQDIIQVDEMYSEYLQIFNEYYDEEKYVVNIVKQLERIF